MWPSSTREKGWSVSRWLLVPAIVVGLVAPAALTTAAQPAPAEAAALAAAVAPVEPTATPTSQPQPEPPPEPDPVDCRVAKCVALTFDDGPSVHTPVLLDTLRRTRTPATFFMLGSRVRAHPLIARRALAEGHQLGTHTWGHPDLRRYNYADVDYAIGAAQVELGRVTGQRPQVFRPPYGAINQHVLRSTRERRLPIIMWDVDPRDWENRNTGRIADHVVRHASRNDIVLLHDIHPTTVRAVPTIIRRLRARGFTLVTVSSIHRHMQPGKVYPHGVRTWWRPQRGTARR